MNVRTSLPSIPADDCSGGQPTLNFAGIICSDGSTVGETNSTLIDQSIRASAGFSRVVQVAFIPDAIQQVVFTSAQVSAAQHQTSK
jgi:hypothetical protein